MDVTQQPVFSGTTVSLQLNLTLVTEEGEEKQTCSSRALLSFSSLPAVSDAVIFCKSTIRRGPLHVTSADGMQHDSTLACQNALYTARHTVPGESDL